MTSDPVSDVSAALASGDAGLAVRLGWEAARPAVLAQDEVKLRRIRSLAEEIALASSGETQREAERLSAYCTACILQPRDTVPSGWSLRRLFARGTSTRKPCPDCAEQIPVDARVCRFCGYRISSPPAE
jgi:hypothetical protein